MHSQTFGKAKEESDSPREFAGDSSKEFAREEFHGRRTYSLTKDSKNQIPSESAGVIR